MLARALARIVFAILLYLCLGTVMFFAGFALLAGGVATELPWLHAVQKNLYHGGLRAVWNNQASCVAFDEVLIYKPKDGACRFRNAEFDTVLNFSAGRRVQKPVSGDGKAIAVIGDSHAMGWGVADDETFSAVLQARLGRPVHNLGVSSYAQARELIALERSGLLASVDLVLIQYNDNDVEENAGFTIPTPQESAQKFAQVTQQPEQSLRDRLPFLYAGLRYALKVPFAAVKKRWRGEPTMDFAPHYQPLVERIRAHPSVKDKEVILFYVNKNGMRFRNFPGGRDKTLPNLRFVDLGIGRENYYALDDHMTAEGHRYVAGKLAEVIAGR